MHSPKSKHQEIRAFLRLHRHKRITDYLDPIDETPLVAFSRRLGWAAEHADDPVHGEEASFILQHAEPMRRMLVQEIEAADAAMDATVIGDEDDLDDTPITEEVSREESPYREQYDLHFGGIMRLEDVTEPPTQPRARAPGYSGPATGPQDSEQPTDRPAPPRRRTEPSPPEPVMHAAPHPDVPGPPRFAHPSTTPEPAAYFAPGPDVAGPPEIETPTPITARSPVVGTPTPPPVAQLQAVTPAPAEPVAAGEPSFDSLREGIRRRNQDGAPMTRPAKIFRPKREVQNVGGEPRSPVWALAVGFTCAMVIIAAFFVYYQP